MTPPQSSRAFTTVAVVVLSCLAVSCASRGSTGKRYNDLPLHSAAVKNDAAKVRQELGKGVNVNATAWGDRTALLYAAYSGSYDAAVALLEANADPTIPDNKGHTPLMWAVRSGRKPLVEAIANTRRGVNLQNRTGNTALHYAAGSRRADLVQVLIAAGADPSIRDIKGRMAVDFAQHDPRVEAALAGKAVPN